MRPAASWAARFKRTANQQLQQKLANEPGDSLDAALRTVYVVGLPVETSDKESLEVFSKYGEVEGYIVQSGPSCRVLRAFVTYRTVSGAARAVQKTQCIVKGRTVRFFHARRASRPGGAGIAYGLPREEGEHLPPHPTIRNLIDGVYRKAGGGSRALALIDRPGLQSVVGRLVQQIQRLCAEGERIGVSTFNAVLRFLAQVGFRRQFSHVWVSMAQQNVTPTAESYNHWLRLEARFGSVASADRVRREMREKGFPLTPPSYLSILMVLSREGRGDAAVELLRVLQKEGKADWQMAIVVLQSSRTIGEAMARVKEFGVEPSAALSRTLLRVCTRSADTVGAEEVFSKIRRPTVRCFANLMAVYEAAGDFDGAMRTLEHMQRELLDPNGATMAMAIVAAAKCCSEKGDRFDVAAHTLFRQAISDGKGASRALYVALLQVCAVTGDVPSAGACMDLLRQNGHTDSSTMHLLLERTKAVAESKGIHSKASLPAPMSRLLRSGGASPILGSRHA